MRALGIGIIFTVRLLLALVAVWQVVGLLPLVSRVSSLSSVTVGMWFVVGMKLAILLLCVLLFWLLGRLLRRMRNQPAQVVQNA